jgi:hypothetical protein
MRNGKAKISLKNIVSILTIASFLTVAQGAAMAASEWELWPKGKGPATEAGKPASPEAIAAAKEGEKAGSSVFEGVDAGTIGWAAAIGAAAIAIGIAAGGGGGGSSTPPSH